MGNTLQMGTHLLVYKMRYERKGLEHAGFKTLNSTESDCIGNILLNTMVWIQDYQISEPLGWD
jgi:hypothetical protein